MLSEPKVRAAYEAAIEVLAATMARARMSDDDIAAVRRYGARHVAKLRSTDGSDPMYVELVLFGPVCT